MLHTPLRPTLEIPPPRVIFADLRQELFLSTSVAGAPRPSATRCGSCATDAHMARTNRLLAGWISSSTALPTWMAQTLQASCTEDRERQLLGARRSMTGQPAARYIATRFRPPPGPPVRQIESPLRVLRPSTIVCADMLVAVRCRLCMVDSLAASPGPSSQRFSLGDPAISELEDVQVRKLTCLRSRSSALGKR
jgi:hypothetical protein